MENATNKSVKDEAQRDAKIRDQIEKGYGITGTPEEKHLLLLKKLAEVDSDNKKLTSALKMHDKRHEAILREKDNLQKEHNKNILMRTKLEQVCREQQKLLKSVQNESMKHKETQAKFQQSINEISSTLTKNNEENIRLKEDNIEMTKKLKYLAEQYQIREKQLEKINEQVEIESQLHAAKLAKVQMEATMEKEILLREKQTALDELLKCKKSIQEMQKREELLKEQLGLYTSKYDDFQSSLQKSNDIFSTYKAELEKMVKKTKKLEKESSDWKRKCEKSTASLLDLATEKQVKDEYIAKTGKQMQQLQKLLRTLQAERTALHKALKENNVEIPPMPILPPEPEAVPLPQLPQSKQEPDKIETMAKSCAELKQSLALLQNQMSALTTKQTPITEQPPTESTSRNKNKKNKARAKNCPVKDRTSSDAQSEKKGEENGSEGIANTSAGETEIVAPAVNCDTLDTSKCGVEQTNGDRSALEADNSVDKNEVSLTQPISSDENKQPADNTNAECSSPPVNKSVVSDELCEQANTTAIPTPVPNSNNQAPVIESV